MKTGRINYQCPSLTISGYLSDDIFSGDVVIITENDNITVSGQFNRIDVINEIEINFENYL